MVINSYAEIPSPNTASQPRHQKKTSRILLGLVIVGMALMTAVTYRTYNTTKSITYDDFAKMVPSTQSNIMKTNWDLLRQQRQQQIRPVTAYDSFPSYYQQMKKFQQSTTFNHQFPPQNDHVNSLYQPRTSHYAHENNPMFMHMQLTQRSPMNMNMYQNQMGFK